MPVLLIFCSLHRAGCAGQGFPPVQSKDAGRGTGTVNILPKPAGMKELLMSLRRGEEKPGGTLQKRGLF